MLDRFETWSRHSTALFGNKLHLLKAEHSFSVNLQDQAKELYKASINAAKDRGDIHEMALAHELLGKYHLERGCHTDGIESLARASIHYDAWGATVIAKKLLLLHNLDSTISRLKGHSDKHGRD